MNNQINEFETWGKQTIIGRTIREVKERFTVNPHAEAILNSHGMKGYVPKLNKVRLTIGIVVAAICVVIPVITPLSIPAMLWGIK